VGGRWHVAHVCTVWPGAAPVDALDLVRHHRGWVVLEASGRGAGAHPHSRLAEDFHPFDIADPFAFYARARAEAAVFYSSELDFWVVTRYRDMLAVFRDPQTFSSENTQAP